MLSNAVQIELTPEANSLIFGVGILGAAFLVGTAALFVGDKERRQQILQILRFVSEAIRT